MLLGPLQAVCTAVGFAEEHVTAAGGVLVGCLLLPDGWQAPRTMLWDGYRVVHALCMLHADLSDSWYKALVR